MICDSKRRTSGGGSRPQPGAGDAARLDELWDAQVSPKALAEAWLALSLILVGTLLQAAAAAFG